MLNLEDYKGGLLTNKGLTKLQNIYNALQTIPVGDTVEIGVCTGHTSKLIHDVYPDRLHHCYDTFAGVQGAQEGIDSYSNGVFSIPLTQVQSLLGLHNVIYHVGFFPDTFNQTNPVSFVHSDTDTYHGTHTSIQKFLPLLSQNGIMILDDYKDDCLGVDKAINEWLANKSTQYEATEFEHQLMIRKLI